jgi:hypothetical protein
MEFVKLVLLKNGKLLITKIEELRDEQDNPLCFILEVPLVVNIIPNENTPDNPKISFGSFVPFSKTFAYRIAFNEVLTIGDPVDSIMEKYVEIVKPYYPVDGGSEPNVIEFKE